MIKLFDPPREEGYLSSVVEAFRSGVWTSGAGGPCVRRFEKDFNKYIGSIDTVAVDSGTSALYLALKSTPCSDREVIVPSLTFVSTVHAIRLAGAKPVFVDVDEFSLNVSITDLCDKLTEDTVALVLVHFAGRPCDMGAISKISKERDLHVVEDCAHACGATYQGKRTGALSDFGCFSFHPVKNLATFSGGAITLNDPDMRRDRLDTARWCGIDTKSRIGSKYDVVDIGWHYYMSEPSAALALAQLPYLDDANRKRREIAKFYDQELGHLDWLKTPPYSDDCVYHLYAIRVLGDRDRFIRHMASKGIECGIHYARGVHQFSIYARAKVTLPVTEKIVNQLVSIPIYPSLTREHLDAIALAVREYK
jgi:perosamine synthetase